MVAQTVQASSRAIETNRDRRQPGLLSLYLMEWFKIPRRRMTQIVFFLMAGAVAFTPFAGYLSRDSLPDGVVDTSNYLLPVALMEMYSTVSTLGFILVAVLAGGLAGSEYGWGTVRTLVGSGAARWKLLAAKFLGLATAVALLVVVGLGAGIVMSMAIGVLDGHSLFGWISSEVALDLLVMTGRSIFLQLFMAALVFAVAQIMRSTAVGIAAGIGILIAEPILLVVINSFEGVSESVGRFLITPNITVIDELNSAHPPIVVYSEEVFEPWAAAGLLTFYAAIAIVAAFVSFIRRDIATG